MQLSRVLDSQRSPFLFFLFYLNKKREKPMCPALNTNGLQQTHPEPAGTSFSLLQNKFVFLLQSDSI